MTLHHTPPCGTMHSAAPPLTNPFLSNDLAHPRGDNINVSSTQPPPFGKMDIFVCPRDWTFATGRFTPDHMVSLQDPGADVSDLRPPWVAPENHYIGYFYDIDSLNHSGAPTEQDVQSVIDWLRPRCGSSSQARFIIHCDAGLGRSTATAYVAWSIFFGAGREQEAFEALQQSCLNLKIIPNSIVVSHADKILQRHGALKKPLTEWNGRATWRRTFR